MLNSTKTWQEEFEQEYWGKFGSTKTINDIKQFISDLRKRDMEALIKKFDDDVRYTSRLIKILIKKHYDLPKM